MVQKKRDWIYIAYLLIHLGPTFLVDAQALQPISNLLPFTQGLRNFYSNLLLDEPLLASANRPEFAWFKAFLWLEILFHWPIFLIGAYGLYRGKTAVYPLLSAYGISAATTTYACIATLFNMPQVAASGDLPRLLGTYVPFLVIPLALSIELGARLTAVARRQDALKIKTA